jgi:catechol 2,3-dioxygenase-like lactoylglutathione lyase family enzyme
MSTAPDGPPLGAFQICLQVADLQVSQDFYSGLGFRVKEGTPAEGFVVLRREDCEIGLFTMPMDGTVMNFRGGNTHAIAAWLTERGHALETNVTNAEDGSGSVILRDPDGNQLFFDSAPAEIAAYEKKRDLYRQL